MAKQILSEEFKRMQVLAGLVTENQLNENMYYVYDIEGLEEPIGPFNLDQANNEKRKLGAGYDIMDEKTAKETWSHLDNTEESLNENENYDPNRMLKLIEMYVNNHFDEGMSAEAAIEKIDELLQGNLDGYDKAFMAGEEDQY